jgi:hypothetical protein
LLIERLKAECGNGEINAWRALASRNEPTELPYDSI